MVLRICSICKRIYGIKFGGWFSPWLSKSHGICSERCTQRWIEGRF
jgi:hypothetical protein